MILSLSATLMLFLTLVATMPAMGMSTDHPVAFEQEVFVNIEGDFSMACEPEDLAVINEFVLDAVTTLVIVHQDHVAVSGVYFDSVETENETLIPAGASQYKGNDTEEDGNGDDGPSIKKTKDYAKEDSRVADTNTRAGTHVSPGEVGFHGRKAAGHPAKWLAAMYRALLRGRCSGCSSGTALFDDSSFRRRGLRGAGSTVPSPSSTRTLEELVEAEMNAILFAKFANHRDADMVTCIDKVDKISLSFLPSSNGTD